MSLNFIINSLSDELIKDGLRLLNKEGKSLNISFTPIEIYKVNTGEIKELK
jgi:hypothetical protein